MEIHMLKTKLLSVLTMNAFALAFVVCSTACAQNISLRKIAQTKGDQDSPAAANSEREVSRFKKIMGFVDGEYEAVNDAKGVCPVGPLIVRFSNNEFTIMIGAELIVANAKIGSNEDSYQESGCQIKIKVDQSANKITSQKTQVCGKQTYNFLTTIESKNEDIYYAVQNSQNGKKSLNVSCRLERQK